MTDWAEVDRIAELGARNSAGVHEPPEFIENRVERAKAYARFRIENYREDGTGECAHPFYESQIKKGPA